MGRGKIVLHGQGDAGDDGAVTRSRGRTSARFEEQHTFEMGTP